MALGYGGWSYELRERQRMLGDAASTEHAAAASELTRVQRIGGAWVGSALVAVVVSAALLLLLAGLLAAAWYARRRRPQHGFEVIQ